MAGGDGSVLGHWQEGEDINGGGESVEAALLGLVGDETAFVVGVLGGGDSAIHYYFDYNFLSFGAGRL